MPDVMADRRGAPRYGLVLVAEVTELATNTQLNARTSDISKSGCYIDTLNPMASGQKVRLRLRRGDITFECRAKVVYVSPGLGMGVAFEEPVPPEQLELLSSWLSRALEL